MRTAVACLPMIGCGEPLVEDTSASSESSTTRTDDAETTGQSPDDEGSITITITTDGEASDADVDSSSATVADTTGGGCEQDCAQVDLLFVIDNSGTMGEEQRNLARNLPLLVQQLEQLTDRTGTPVNPDVQIMVTTTDFGNPHCTPFEPDGYDPAQGAPTTTGCNARIDDFTGLTQPPLVMSQACTDVCPADLAPDDPFIAFSPEGDNVPDVPDFDVNGDGVPDSAVAQTLACIGPQGINGCGYEAPLETMLQALNPGAPWNDTDRPFLRDGALLAIVHITDEADCSVNDYSIMEDDAYQEVNPNNGTRSPSSAICWNAGVACNGPDAMGVYSDCASIDDDALEPVTRYTNYLVDELRENQDKEVVMLGLLGVPPVLEHDPIPPYAPTAGGVFDLVYRDWQDGEYPAGDILPDEWADGVTAEDKQFDFGIGPGCTGEDGMGGFTGQAIPNTRVMEVCQALDYDGNLRCCIESICDVDFSGAMQCLSGIIGTAIELPE
jgi:hypothetical protein